MKQFPRRPETISAILFDGNNVDQIKGAVKDKNRITTCDHPVSVQVLTNHGWVIALPGDWIVQREDGELYPCKPELFEQLADTTCEVPAKLPAHMKRVFVEKHQLDTMADGLGRFANNGYPGASDEEQELLGEQQGHMAKYSEVLGKRLAMY